MTENRRKAGDAETYRTSPRLGALVLLTRCSHVATDLPTTPRARGRRRPSPARKHREAPTPVRRQHDNVSGIKLLRSRAKRIWIRSRNVQNRQTDQRAMRTSLLMVMPCDLWIVMAHANFNGSCVRSAKVFPPSSIVHCSGPITFSTAFSAPAPAPASASAPTLAPVVKRTRGKGRG